LLPATSAAWGGARLDPRDRDVRDHIARRGTRRERNREKRGDDLVDRDRNREGDREPAQVLGAHSVKAQAS
jgi:hypothetical protein